MGERKNARVLDGEEGGGEWVGGYALNCRRLVVCLSTQVVQKARALGPVSWRPTTVK